MPAETPAAGSEASAMLAELKHTISLGPDAAANAAQRLHRVVEAVLKLHQPGPFVLLGALCAEHAACRNFSITSSEADRVAHCTECSATVQRTCTHGSGALWPCTEYEAITRELLGEEGSDRA